LLPSLYPRLLGTAWSTLPAVVRECHDAAPRLEARGRFTVTHATSWLARIAIWFANMPPARRDIPLRLQVRTEGDLQVWERDFDGFTMTTVQLIHDGALLAERRGPFELLFRIAVVGGTVTYEPAGLRLGFGGFRVRVPAFFGPTVRARAGCDDGGDAMNVRVEIGLPFFGTLVTYGGSLRPVQRGVAGPLA
jgi:hypothetical protein